MALISVVIPCYNAGAFIRNTLTALEKQTFQDFNVILVDDCSPDDTARVIAEYKAESPLEILYTRNEHNSGPALSRNYGIQMSDAAYICFCDSDDWYDADYLENLVAAAGENGADMVFCGYKVAFTDGRTPLLRPLPVEAGTLPKTDALLLNVDSLCCLMVRREIAAGFPLPDLRNGEDMAVIPVWMMQAETFAADPRPMYNYLLRGDSLSNRTSLKVVDSLEASFAHICENMVQQYSLQVEYIGIRNVIYGALLNLFKCGNFKKRAGQVVDAFTEAFPNWKANPYIDRLPLFKRVFIRLSAKKHFGFVRWMSRLHQAMTKRE